MPWAGPMSEMSARVTLDEFDQIAVRILARGGNFRFLGPGISTPIMFKTFAYPFFDGVGPDAPDEKLLAIAPGYPVFVITER